MTEDSMKPDLLPESKCIIWAWRPALEEAASFLEMNFKGPPVFQLKLHGRCHHTRSRTTTGPGFFPVIRLASEVEFRRDRRICNLPQLNLQTEKVDILAGDVVEPIQRSAVLLGELARNPHDSDGVEAGRVGKQLAEVAVVGAFELILDEDPGIRHRVLAQDIGAEGADVALGGLQLQFEPDGFAEQGQVLLFRLARA